MCLCSFWTALQVLWCSIYVICGTIQLVVGIFFLISVPLLNFSTFNVVSSFISISLGVISGTIVCFGKLSPRRQEILLYIACSVLIINLTATILREWDLYFQDFTEIIKNHPQPMWILSGCFAVRVTATTVIISSFLDSQFAFCSMQINRAKKYRNDQRIRGVRRNTNSEDSLADITYIINRKSSTKSPSKPHAIYNAYAQNWVFESDLVNSSNNLADCTKNSSLLNGTNSPSPKNFNTTTTTTQLGIVNNGNVLQEKNCANNANSHLTPVIVQIDETSDDSDSYRKLSHMKSFSRATSPAQLSSTSSQISLSSNNQNNMKPPIHEYLEKLTESEIYRSRLNSALSEKSDYFRDSITMKRIESVSPQSEKVLYASFMQELQKAIVDKKEHGSDDSIRSDGNGTCSKPKNDEEDDDGKFSRELEAALQLIQDLESPNNVTIPTGGGVGDVNVATATVTPISEFRTFKPQQEEEKNPNFGKGTYKIVNNKSSSSQSTSGYSSPNHNTTPTNWSAASSINNEIIHQPISYSIHNSNKHTTVISLYTPSNSRNDKIKNEANLGKSVTLVSINGDDRDVNKAALGRTKDVDVSNTSQTNNMEKIQNNTVSNGWKSLLRKKSQKPPKLCPELEGAIVKSESLAYLTDVELLARHQRNNEMHRKIEERVIQQLGVPRSESKC